MNFETILTKNVIFTDCFNTLLLRKCSANEVIFEFCKLLGDKYNTEPAYFYNHFTQIKNKLALERFLKTGEAEYGFMANDALADRFTVDICGDNKENLQFKNDCHDFYIQAETQNLAPNTQLINTLRKCKENGCKIYLVSDFYCEKEMIAKILENFSILDIFEDVFVSCDHLASKRTGRLYKKVLGVLNLSPSQVVMIGDNKKSDWRNAKRCKIQSVKVDTKSVKSARDFKKRTKFAYNYDKFLAVQKSCPEYNYSNFAFPLYLFIKRLDFELKERGAKDVFFLAREGQYLMKLYQLYSSILGEKKALKTPITPQKWGGGGSPLLANFTQFYPSCKPKTFGRRKL